MRSVTRLDQRRSTALTCLLDRALGLPVDGENVGAVDDDPVEAIGGGTVCQVIDGMVEVGRRRVRPLVVVDDEDDGKPPDAGEVHPLVRVPARCGTVAAPGEGNPALLADAEREPHPDCDREHRGQVAHHRVQPEPRVAEMDVPVATARRPVGAAHVLREDPPRLDAAGDVDAHVALQRAADVVGPHRARDSDGGGLVAASGVERARDLALLVEDVAALLDPARRQHVAIHAEEVLAVEAYILHLLERADAAPLPVLPWRSPRADVGRHSTLSSGGRCTVGGYAPCMGARDGRSGTGSRRSAARRSATGSPSASTAGSRVRYFVELEAELPAACPGCAGEVRHLCPACGARFPSAFLVECEECGAEVRPNRALRRADSQGREVATSAVLGGWPSVPLRADLPAIARARAGGLEIATLEHVPMIWEKRITVTVSLSVTSRL